MTSVEMGDGITPSEAPLQSPAVFQDPNLEAIRTEVRASMRAELDAAVADIERRLGQARQLERSALFGEERQVHAEDLNLNFAVLDGYTLTSNSPSGGSIAWASLHVVYQGVDYTITDGNTANRFVWFVKPGSGTTAVLSSSNTQPTLGPNDTLLFINNAGVAVDVTTSNVAWAVGTAVIGDTNVSSLSQSKISGLATSLQAGLDAAAAAQATADGAITQTFGAAFPWANGTVKPAANTSDIHTFQGNADQVAFPDGTSYRWNGPGGTPTPNQWILVTDTALSKALADSASALSKVSTKVTVYYRTVAQGAPPTPSGGFTTGDQWVQTDNGSYTQYWTGAAWAAQLFGDAALSGISGAKVGTGISPANLTGAGTVPIAGVPSIPSSKLNTAFHILY